MLAAPKSVLLLLAALTGNPFGDFRAGLDAEKSGDDAGAARWLARAVAEAPGWSLPKLELAQLRLKLGQAADARRLAGDAVRVDGENPRGWHLLGLAADAVGDAAAAETAEAKALALRPGYFEARQHLAQILWNEGKRGPAIEQLVALVAARPGDVALLAQLASAEEDAGRTDAAEQALRTLVEIQPANPAWHRRLGRLLSGEGKATAASAEFARADHLAGEQRKSRHLRPLLPSKR